MIFRKSAKIYSQLIFLPLINNILYVGVYVYVQVVAVDVPSPAEVFSDRKNCAELLYSLSEGNKTGERAHEPIFHE